MQLLLMKEKRKDAFEPSRLFILYNEREIEGKQTWDAPVYMRDGIQSVSRTGVCPEPLWPQASSITEKPSDEAYLAAGEHRAVRYRKVPHDLPHMRGCLATGYPFTIGIHVYLSYESAMATGDILTPDPATEMHRGGHALLVVGYDQNQRRFLVRNSEGDCWGHGGYGTLPYECAPDPRLSDSLWTLRYAT